MKGLLSSEVCGLLGLSQRQLDTYCKAGLVSPSIKPANGHGSVRVWSKDDLVQILVLRSLLEAGFSLELCGKPLSRLRDYANSVPSWLLTNGAMTAVSFTDQPQPGPKTWAVVVNLTQLRKTVDQLVAMEKRA